MLKNIKTIILMTVLTVCTTACSRSNTPLTQPYYGNIQESFTELARTQLENTYNINMPLSGELERIHLKPGDPVQKNQVVAQLVREPWENAVTDSRAIVRHAHTLHEQQLQELKRIKELHQQKFASQADLDNAQFKTNALQALINRAEATLSTAEYNLKLITIHSPIDGVILKRFTQGQQWLPEGTLLLQIGNLNEIEAVSDVLTHQAQQLHPNDPVILTSLDKRLTLQGKVARIDPAGFTKKSSLGVDEQRVYVIVHLINSQNLNNLGVEFQLQAQFLIGQPDKKALLIPRFSVLQDEQGKYYVFKVKDNILQKQVVEIGMMTDQEISIKKGLTVEDFIVTQPTADMFDGMKI
jgi:RND family efflux transporter MFP subunit